MKATYEVRSLGNSRFPSVFFITIKNEGTTKKEMVSTNQHSSSQTKFTGEKPEEISEFLHAKLCIISVVNFYPELSEDERVAILQSSEELIKVGVINIINL